MRSPTNVLVLARTERAQPRAYPYASEALRKGPSLPFERVSALARKRRERLLGIVDELRNTRPIYAELGAPDEASTIKKAIEGFQITERWKQSRLVARRRARPS